MARLAIFVDGGYLDEIAENCGVRIDFVKLADEIKAIVSADTAEPVSLVRTYYYICPPYQGNPPSQEDRERYGKYRHFADALERLPKFQIREGRLEARGVGDAGKLVFVQKRLDLLLGLDFASLSAKQAVTHIALVAGDSDLIPAVQIAKQEGVGTWLFHGPWRTYHSDLWKEADDRHEMDATFLGRCQRQAHVQPIPAPTPRRNPGAPQPAPAPRR
jgi:uncharacterized LabA/DUF88 family protein